MANPPNRIGYILYVDESGDDGFATVRPFDPDGGSEWLIISGVLLRADEHLLPVKWVKDFKRSIRGAQRLDLHFADLTDPQKLAACHFLASKQLTWFAVVSNKRNLRGYRNARAEKHDTRNPLYNWLLRILLERVSNYCSARSALDYGELRSLRVELSARGGLSLPRTQVYVWHKLRPQSRAGTLVLQRGDIAWDVMDINQIEIFQSRRRAGLQLADIVASAVGQAVESKPDGSVNTEYAEILAPLVASNMNWETRDFGFKLMPDLPEIRKIGLSANHVRFLQRFGYTRHYLMGPDT